MTIPNSDAGRLSLKICTGTQNIFNPLHNASYVWNLRDFRHGEYRCGRDDFACPIPLARGKHFARMSQAETGPGQIETQSSVILDASPIYVRVSPAEKAEAEAEARAGGFRSTAEWARQKLFYNWKKPGALV